MTAFVMIHGAGSQGRVARERLGAEVEDIPGEHLVALSRPVELTERLERYAAAPEAAPRLRFGR